MSEGGRGTFDELRDRIRELEEALRENKRQASDDESNFKRLSHEKESLEKELTEWRKKKSQIDTQRDKLSQLRMLGYEIRVDSVMRMLVVATFAFVGPILLIVYVGGGLNVDPLILDIFKIWLGAAIGISTNLLQKTERIPTISEEAKPTSTEEKAQKKA